jgi:hypothetical protein
MDEAPSAADLIADLVAGGQTLQGAMRTLATWLPKDVLDQAKADYEAKVGRIVEMEDPRALVDKATIGKPWYGGPQEKHTLWPALRKVLEDDLPVSVVDGVEKSATKIVGLMSPPGAASIRTRGLVLGHVQSGKTTSFQAVSALAADVGYRFVIVLSGITDNLRTQTQVRVDEQLIGMQTDKWIRLTDADSDFHETKNAAVHMTAGDKRLVAVVKKNPARLRRLAEWIESAGEAAQLSCPILLIDDEADQASIDVGKQRRSVINDLIRRILKAPKSAYIAYTATPFANLLINPSDVEGLYPRDFIVPLRAGEDYYGPERLFGRDLLEHVDDPTVQPDDVVRVIKVGDGAQVQPPKGKGAVHSWAPTIPPSLEDAVDWFLLASAARRARGHHKSHSSMLIHTTMLADAHFKLQAKVEEHCASRRDKVSEGHDRTLSDLRALWEREVDQVPRRQDERAVPWRTLLLHLVSVLNDLDVVVDNYRSTDRLVYSKSSAVTCIAIGGNTLSRGLTLEGLVSSYFVRAASAYDTLLQMGRWFGYRRGYSDLVRIWMTEELAEWFRDLATVEAEIRAEIERYELEGLEPSQLAVKIRMHPSMSITNAAKMRDAVQASLSYSGTREQTILFDHLNKSVLESNWTAASELVSKSLGDPGVERTSSQNGGRHVLRGVPVSRVREFLSNFSFHPDSRRFRADLLDKYIDKEVQAGGLSSWTVVVSGTEAGSQSRRLGDVGEVKLGSRTQMRSSKPGTANIKALVGSGDRGLDLAPELLEELPSNPKDKDVLALRRKHGLGPLLVLYPLAATSSIPPQAKDRKPLDAVAEVVGVALYFPDSIGESSGVDYVAANIAEVEESDIDFAALDAAEEQLVKDEEAKEQS